MFAVFILFVAFHSSSAAIHKLNDSDYARMPLLFHLDNYEECFDEPNAMYCAAEILLVSDKPSELLTMIQEYSAFPSHYNRSLLRHGYCMNKSCKKFYNDSEVDLRLSLEACMNESLYKKYNLKSVVLETIDCSKRDRVLPIEYLDIVMALICIVILMANFIGSLCDLYLEKGRDCGGLKYLYCFSIFRNWKKFIAPPGKYQKDLRVQALKGIHGFRALTTILVILCHAGFIAFMNTINPEKLEDAYEIKFFHIFSNGTLIMQTFLVISSFLLVYNWLITLEKHKLSWKMLPQQIIMRWLRLTPSYALILGMIVTWFGRLASGPFWKMFIYKEISDCRSNWWKHLLYINNYVDGSTCMPHTWYLAADTQLYILGIIIFLICRTGLTRKVGLSLLFVAGLIIPTLHIYYQRLNGNLVHYPEMTLRIFTSDPTFDHVYKRGHTNLTGCVIGMAVGYMIYYWQKSGGDPKNFRKYRYWYWSLFFCGALVSFSGSILYQHDHQQPIYVHMLLGALMKPTFGMIVAACMAGVIIQFEGLYRPVLEWQPFVYIGRLSYSTYLLHVVIIKTELVSVIATHRLTDFSISLKCCTIVMGTLVVSFFFWMLVENPFGSLLREFFGKANAQNEGVSKGAVEEIKKTEDKKGTDVNDTKIADGIVIKMETKVN